MTIELYNPGLDYAAASAGSGANLTYRGGPLMSHSKIVGVFFDELDGTPYVLTKEMSAFLSFLMSSDVISNLVEYDEPGYALEKGSHIGDARLSIGGSAPPPPPPPPPPNDCTAALNALIACLQAGGSVGHHHKQSLRERIKLSHEKHRAFAATVVLQDSDVQKLISDAMAAGKIPQPDADTLYVCFFPTDVEIQLGQDASCQTFCGYHDQFMLGGSPVQYAVIPHPDCSGCLGGMAAKDALTSVVTHEICEAITDPAPGSGWYDDANGEIGDICAWQTRVDGGYTVQLEWSDKHNSCI